MRWEAGRYGAEIATEGRWMGVRVIQRGAAVTGAHLEGRGSQGHGGRRRGRLPRLAAALINAAERIFLPTSNFLLSLDKQVFAEVGDFRFHKSRVATFQGGLQFFFPFCVHKQEENKKKNPTHLWEGKQSRKPVKQNKRQRTKSNQYADRLFLSVTGAPGWVAASPSLQRALPRGHICVCRLSSPSPAFAVDI